MSEHTETIKFFEPEDQLRALNISRTAREQLVRLYADLRAANRGGNRAQARALKLMLSATDGKINRVAKAEGV